jgi:hypothetical protein
MTVAPKGNVCKPVSDITLVWGRGGLYMAGNETFYTLYEIAPDGECRLYEWRNRGWRSWRKPQ